MHVLTEGKDGIVASGAESSSGSKVLGALQTFGAAIVRLLKRIEEARQGRVKRRRIELVETLALGGKLQLFMVLCDNQRYLVGAGADSVGTIVAIDANAKPTGAVPGPQLVRPKNDAAGPATKDAGPQKKHFDGVSEIGSELWH